MGLRGVYNATHPGPRNDPEGREAASLWSHSIPARERVRRGSGKSKGRGSRSENGKVQCQRGQTRNCKVHEGKYEKEMGIAAAAAGGRNTDEGYLSVKRDTPKMVFETAVVGRGIESLQR